MQKLEKSLSKEYPAIAAGIGALAVIIVAALLLTKPEPGNGVALTNSTEEGWSKLTDAGLGIELEYPSFLSVTHDAGTAEGGKSVQLYRTIAYGERPGCNESGTARPREISYPDIRISIDNRSWDKYLADVTAEYDMTPTEIEESYKKGSFSGSRTYYTKQVGWEGECNYQITYLPVDGNRLAIVTEPALFDEVDVTGEGIKTVTELTEGEPSFDSQMRERLLTSIRVRDFQQ